MCERSTSKQGNERKSFQLKEMIGRKAQRGVFDHNPLVSTVHFVTCQKCKHRQSIVYLDYLKSGEFEFGKAEQIEVFTSPGPISFTEAKKVTSIIINLICEECGYKIEARPVSAEYLKAIIDKPKTSGTLYV